MKEFWFLSLFLFPILGFLINGLVGRNRFTPLVGALVAIGASITSFVAALFLADSLWTVEDRTIDWSLGTWIAIGDLKIAFRFILDPISILMTLLITGVGSLIHIFSYGYMKDDPGVVKYFSYLNLFLFNMLILVTADSLPLLFVGWEGVGLCSYLLIGYWFEDEEKARAGMKAFIVNRIGDAAFILGMFFLFNEFGTLSLQTLNGLVPKDPIWDWSHPLVLGSLFLFMGATGKSAQIPLYIWLPDAMAGPTPVSALIHAATMVTAGVYMLVRLSSVYMAVPAVMMVIAWVGVLTALLAAFMGLAQYDIKKVLAYSTVSQLGFMFLACGVGAFSAAFFHLLTHAFFKALMFLGSGSVIHGMHHEQDMRKMGGLKKYMPVTYWTFVIGWLAIIGLPPFSGFFSKDEILWMTFGSSQSHFLIWLLALVAACCTAFYMTRLMCLTFWGEERFDKNHPPHESPLVMTGPLFLLAILAFFGGWMGVPHALGEVLPGHPQHWLESWFEGIVAQTENRFRDQHELEWMLMGLSTGLSILFALMGFLFYSKLEGLRERLKSLFPKIHSLLLNKFYIDELYATVFVKPFRGASEVAWAHFDVGFIDQIVEGVARTSKGFGRWGVLFQTGNLQLYLMVVFFALVFLMGLVLL